MIETPWAKVCSCGCNCFVVKDIIGVACLKGLKELWHIPEKTKRIKLGFSEIEVIDSYKVCLKDGYYFYKCGKQRSFRAISPFLDSWLPKKFGIIKKDEIKTLYVKLFYEE